MPTVVIDQDISLVIGRAKSLFWNMYRALSSVGASLNSVDLLAGATKEIDLSERQVFLLNTSAEGLKVIIETFPFEEESEVVESLSPSPSPSVSPSASPSVENQIVLANCTFFQAASSSLRKATLINPGTTTITVTYLY